MKERPLLMNGPMVRASLRPVNPKGQTRRVVTPQPNAGPRGEMVDLGGAFGLLDGELSGEWRCPYGVVGDRLWVREAWRTLPGWDQAPPRDCYFLAPGDARFCPVQYEADGARSHVDLWDDQSNSVGRYRHARFMPRWASRITLEITDVRAQRLQAITDDDAKAEGLSLLSKDGGRTWKFGIPDRDGQPGADDDGWHWYLWSADPITAYLTLWDLINEKRDGGAYSWIANPYVWAISFKRVAPATIEFRGRAS